MSGTILNSIPASTIVNVVPSVVTAGGSALDLVGLMLSNNTRTPIGSVLSFPTLASVASYYGATSVEYNHAQKYFGGYTIGTKLPASLLITQYNTAAVSAYLRGGNISGLTLTQLQALGSGTIIITVNGSPVTSSTINLSGASSFSSAAQLMTTGLGLTGPTQAVVTGTVGFVGVGTASGANLTFASVSTGVISVGDTITGTGISGTVTILSQTSGTPGAAGVYVTSATTTATSATITGTSTKMNVTAVTSGTLAVGYQITGAGVTAGTYITALGTGAGGVGTYTLTNAFQVASITLTAVQPTVTYDSTQGAFTIISGSTGASSTVGYATGTLATGLLLTQATGAVLSQGAIAAVPSTFMNNIVGTVQNWATFWTNFDPDAGSGNAQKILFAGWNNGQNNRYVYMVADTDITPTQSSTATTSLGYILKANATSGTCVIYQPTEMYLPAIFAGVTASIDFNRTNARITFAFKRQSGMGISVTTATAQSNLRANGYNWTGNYADANDNFLWFYPGTVTGLFTWLDTYVNQIWLNNALQQALLSLLDQTPSVPYNPQGYGLIRAACLDPILAGLNFGAIRTGVPLSEAQKAIVNNQAGQTIDIILNTRGWYLQIQPATAQVRAARTSPTMTLWYMDGEAVQQITLASIVIQ